MNIDILIVIAAFLVVMAINISLCFRKIATLSKILFVSFLGIMLWITVGVSARAYLSDSTDLEIQNNHITVEGEPIPLKEAGIILPDDEGDYKVRRTKCPGRVFGISFSKNVFYKLLSK